jgi:hypothetical protein
VGISDEECCRVPACGRPAVGYIQVGSRGRREVYVGHPAGLNHIPVCAEHLQTAASVGHWATAHVSLGSSRVIRAS